MFFTRIASVLAHLAFWLGCARLAAGAFIAATTPDMAANAAAARRYLAAASSGEAINGALVMIVAGVVLGVLAEIGARRD